MLGPLSRARVGKQEFSAFTAEAVERELRGQVLDQGRWPNGGPVDIARLSWLLSQIRVEAVTKESARRSAGLLKTAGLHGHKYAIDAMVAEVALRLPAPVGVLTSDVDDMAKLCGRRVRTIGL